MKIQTGLILSDLLLTVLSYYENGLLTFETRSKVLIPFIVLAGLSISLAHCAALLFFV